MCEMLYLRKNEPFMLAEVLPYGLVLDRFGLTGFGWGVAWVKDGQITHYRSELSLAEDRHGQIQLGDVEADACLFHLRRPSFLSTIAVRNTQPYLKDEAFAFGHNGYLADSTKWRDELKELLVGESDSEIGFVKYQGYLAAGYSRVDALTKTVDDTLGDGTANVIAMHKDGSAVATGRNHMNRLWQFRGLGFEGVVTEVHSPDGTLFQKFFPWMNGLKQITGAVEVASQPMVATNTD